MNIIGKTIAKITEMKKPQYDDTGWLKMDFTDGTHCIIWAGYGSWTSHSEDEYPTCIGITDHVDGLVSSDQN